MNDNIKGFIQQQRQAFDTATPGQQVWAGIEQALRRWPDADPAERFVLLNRPLLDTAAPSEKVLNALEKECRDELEIFIAGNREALDFAAPPADLWKNITSALPVQATTRPAKTIGLFAQGRLFRAAAAIALLLTATGVGYWFGTQQPDTPAGMGMADVSMEYAELEQYYQRDIASKQQELTRLASNRDEDVFNDLRQMDQAMEELRKELANVPPGNREQVVRAMIENYKAKLAILQRVLEHMQPSSDFKNTGKNETQSI
jgi:hypothetical protein